MKTKPTNTSLQELLKKPVLLVKGKQHIKTEQGINYIIDIDTDKDKDKIVTEKVGDDLEITLADKTVIVFDDYFIVCEVDLSCLVSIEANTVYYVDNTSLEFLPIGEASAEAIATSSGFSAASLLPVVALGGGGSGGSGSSSNQGKTISDEDTPPNYDLSKYAPENIIKNESGLTQVDGNGNTIAIPATDKYKIVGNDENNYIDMRGV